MLQNLNSEGAVLTGARQTMASWSRVIESYEDVPDLYRSFFETQIADNKEFPYVVLAPAIAKPRGRTTEKLIYDTIDAIHILERNGSQVVAKCYPYRSVCSVEMGCILLDSWLTLSGLTSTGEASVSTVDYNTASARHYAAFINKLRPSLQSADEMQLKAEKEKFDYLSPLNFKFMNYGRGSLVAGETASQILLQPEIREPIWALLGGMFQHTVSLAHLVILTDHELILIQDIHERGRKAQKANYGGIWQYIPLHNIRSVTWTETENGWLTLAVMVSPDRKIEKIFEASSKGELEKLCACFR